MAILVNYGYCFKLNRCDKFSINQRIVIDSIVYRDFEKTQIIITKDRIDKIIGERKYEKSYNEIKIIIVLNNILIDIAKLCKHTSVSNCFNVIESQINYKNETKAENILIDGKNYQQNDIEEIGMKVYQQIISQKINYEDGFITSANLTD